MFATSGTSSSTAPEGSDLKNAAGAAGSSAPVVKLKLDDAAFADMDMFRIQDLAGSVDLFLQAQQQRPAPQQQQQQLMLRAAQEQRDESQRKQQELNLQQQMHLHQQQRRLQQQQQQMSHLQAAMQAQQASSFGPGSAHSQPHLQQQAERTEHTNAGQPSYPLMGMPSAPFFPGHATSLHQLGAAAHKHHPSSFHQASASQPQLATAAGQDDAFLAQQLGLLGDAPSRHGVPVVPIGDFRGSGVKPSTAAASRVPGGSIPSLSFSSSSTLASFGSSSTMSSASAGSVAPVQPPPSPPHCSFSLTSLPDPAMYHLLTLALTVTHPIIPMFHVPLFLSLCPRNPRYEPLVCAMCAVGSRFSSPGPGSPACDLPMAEAMAQRAEMLVAGALKRVEETQAAAGSDSSAASSGMLPGDGGGPGEVEMLMMMMDSATRHRSADAVLGASTMPAHLLGEPLEGESLETVQALIWLAIYEYGIRGASGKSFAVRDAFIFFFFFFSKATRLEFFVFFAPF
jgi:hypothetical protein